MAELLAIKEAFLIYAASSWAHQSCLIVESDSRNSVKWVTEIETAPWRFRQVLFKMEELKKKVSSWKVVHIYREVNHIADGLAKSIIGKSTAVLSSFLLISFALLLLSAI
ncbi:hypothetical protein COLO4_11284 [Corchorus olitorius]|uniref:RNase H type-1 domain-containing protein n=1 Tax=Corchorus olitorius TaxID=93759 RepID=A0A1R3K5D3_9ROSI|nr:hypothetical protein COLO4_11284 [Corchorus olitorius]